MILADTSVWIEHIRHALHDMRRVLLDHELVMHEFVVGELVCGNLPDRTKFISMLMEVPRIPIAGHAEVMELVETNRLMGRGLGWVDAHLLTSTVKGGHRLWTFDATLSRAAHDLSVLA